MDTIAYSFLIFLALLLLGYIAGTLSEKNHYRSIINREKAYRQLPAITTRSFPYSDRQITSAALVYGSAVISVDYFKRFLAMLCILFGGRVKSYESLMDRARRESLLRMKEMAIGASIIINVRVETSAIAYSTIRKNITCLEAIAYGTALFPEK